MFGPLMMFLIYMLLWQCKGPNSKFKQPPEPAHGQGIFPHHVKWEALINGAAGEDEGVVQSSSSGMLWPEPQSRPVIAFTDLLLACGEYKREDLLPCWSVFLFQGQKQSTSNTRCSASMGALKSYTHTLTAGVWDAGGMVALCCRSEVPASYLPFLYCCFLGQDFSGSAGMLKLITD